MLYFLLTRRTRFTVAQLLSGRARHLASMMELLYYEDLHLKKELRPGTLAFMDMDRMSPLANATAAKIHEYLSGYSDGLRILNHPVKTLNRFALLKTLHASGINNYQIYKATDDHSSMKMPVYLRSALGHNLIVSDLLYNQKAMRHAILQLRLLGHDPDQIYVVEFCDTSDAHGIFTKYSAFKIGDDIIPRHVNFNTHWIVKSNAAKIDLHLHTTHQDHIEWYFSTHPHKAWLEKVFNIAGIEYGRADYSVLNGKPQLWEINTNPSYGSGRGALRNDDYAVLEEPFRKMFYEAFFISLRSLATEHDNASPIPLDPIRPSTLEIHKLLQTPEERVQTPLLQQKIANSKRRWIVLVWKMVLNILDLFTSKSAKGNLTKKSSS